MLLVEGDTTDVAASALTADAAFCLWEVGQRRFNTYGQMKNDRKYDLLIHYLRLPSIHQLIHM